jgi:hypothetical protein
MIRLMQFTPGFNRFSALKGVQRRKNFAANGGH